MTSWINSPCSSMCFNFFMQTSIYNMILREFSHLNHMEKNKRRRLLGGCNFFLARTSHSRRLRIPHFYTESMCCDAYMWPGMHSSYALHICALLYACGLSNLHKQVCQPPTWAGCSSHVWASPYLHVRPPIYAISSIKGLPWPRGLGLALSWSS